MPHTYNSTSNDKEIEVIIDERDEQGSSIDTMKGRFEHAKKEPFNAAYQYGKDHVQYQTVALEKAVTHRSEGSAPAYGGVGLTALLALGIYASRILKKR